jgi:hypothetical protein
MSRGVIEEVTIPYDIFRTRDYEQVDHCLGFAIRMFFNDHDPPLFLVRYQQFRARVRIEDGQTIDGRLPPTVTRVVKEWTVLRRDALMKNWIAARTDGRLEWIEGLE